MTQWEENNKIIDDLRIEKQTKNYGVYAIRLIDNKLLNDSNLEQRKIYIGYSKNVKDRWRDEIYKAFNEKEISYKTPLSCFFRAYCKTRDDVKNICEFNLIGEFDTIEEALKVEIEYILKFKTNINCFGKLYGYNLTAGGDGASGYKPTEEQKLKKSIIMKKHNAENGRTKEHCENISKGKVGTIFSDEHRNNLSVAQKNRPISDLAVNATIDFDTAKFIRLEFLTGEYSTEFFSKKYNLNPGNIRNIIYNKIWIDKNYIPNIDLIKEILHSKKSQIKLNREIVNKIRNDFMNGGFSFADFARIYNVQNSLIGGIIYNVRWHDENYNPDIKLIKKIIKNLKSKLAIKNLEKINANK